MALDPLAVADDLTARGITVPSGMNRDTLLAVASDQVRDAAGCPISQVTSTITLSVRGDNEYLALPGPISSVASVTVNDVVITDYTLSDNQLWRFGGWRTLLLNETSFFLPRDIFKPSTVVVTFTHGLETVPTDIVDLVCELVSRRAAMGYSNDPRITSEAVDDYRISYVNGQPVISEQVREALRNRFTSTAYVTPEASR